MEPDLYNLGTLILRIALGVVMFAHGWNHIFGGGKIAGTGRWFASMGMKPGPLHAWLASLTELGAAVLLLLGLLTPLGCAGVIGVMVVALLINHLKNGFFIFRPGEGYEYVAFVILTALALAALGSGEWSLDEALDYPIEGWAGFWLALGAGVGGALLLLAVFWRPAKPAE